MGFSALLFWKGKKGVKIIILGLFKKKHRLIKVSIEMFKGGPSFVMLGGEKL